MRKLLAILLTCVMTIGVMVIPVAADEIYYPCYIGTWENHDSGNPVKLKINSANGNYMSFYFQYGQFAVNIYNAKVSGAKVNGSYREEWEGGEFIVSGTVALTLYDTGIWLDWHPYENGRDGGTQSFMMRNGGFSYKSIRDTNVKVILNGQQINFDQNPVMLSDRVLVPIRAIGEALGAKVDWYERRNSVVLEKDSKNMAISIDSTYMSITEVKNGTPILSIEITLDVPSVLYHDRTLVPVRAVSEAFGANVSWDGDSQTVNISTTASNQTSAPIKTTEITPEKAKSLTEQALRKKFADSDYGYEAYQIKYFVADYGTKYLVCALTTAMANGEDRYMVNKTDGSLSYLGCASDWHIESDGTVTWCDGETAPPDGSKQVNKNIYEF